MTSGSHLAQLHEFNIPEIKKILLTGGAGYIGSALLPLLLETGYQVRLIDLFIYGKEAIQPWLDHPQLEVIPSDLRQTDLIEQAMQGIDAVVHLGAIVADAACDLNENIAVEVNQGATETIAEIAKSKGIRRFIFASSCSVYGDSDQSLDETSQIKPLSLYSRSKAVSETTLIQLADDHFSPVILRFSTVYGLSGRYRFDLVVNLLTAKAIMDGVITIHGGNQWRAFVHVQDVAWAILQALTAPRQVVQGQVFNVGSDTQNYTISQVGEIIHKHVPSARIITEDQADPKNYRVNFHKISRMLNFVPRWTIDQGIEQVMAAIRGGLVKDYRDPHFNNAAFLSAKGLDLLLQAESTHTSNPHK
jgi:nucleoside-diphosphate-sugar epimerase